MSINRVMLSGNLTRDPELRVTAGGTQVLSFGIAVNDRRRNQQTGEWEDYPNFVDCTLFGNRAEPLSRFLSKGTKVAIEGKLRYSSWQAKDGTNRSKLEVVVDELDFMSSRNQGQSDGSYQQTYQQPTYSAPTSTQANNGRTTQTSRQQNRNAAPVQTPPETDVYDEDIPF